MAALSHTQFLARHRFADLDGLRAIAVLAVIWHHTHPAGATGLLARSGYQGVTLFFAISGFLITSLLIRERLRQGQIDLRAFYIRRSLRIFPLYFATLLLYTLLVATVERSSPAGAEFWRNLPYFATYTSNLFVPLNGERVIFYFAWSLAAEEQFYLLWPPLLVLLGRPSAGAMALLAALAAGIAGASVGLRAMVAVPFAILWGALLAVLLHDRTWHDRIAPWLGSKWAPAVAAGAFLASVLMPGLPGYLQHLIAALLVSSCVLQDVHGLSRYLNCRTMTYLGSISYGLYMLHMLCKNVATKTLGLAGVSHLSTWGDTLVFPLTALLAVAAASLSFRWLERPILAWKTRFER